MNLKNNENIVIIGAGYVGLCTGAILYEIGNNIIFLDIDQNKVEKINAGKSPIYEPGLDEIIRKGVMKGAINATNNYDDIKNYKIFIISVNTPINNKYDVNLRFFVEALKSLSKIIKKGSLVIIRSTIPPLTIKNVVIPMFDKINFKLSKDYYLAMVPERLAEGHALKDMRENPLIIGATDELTYVMVEKLFEPLKLKSIRLSYEEAELVKLADNMWIDLNIALANELALVSEKIGGDIRKVIDAANTLKKGSSYVNILTPGIGVGGSCLPKDPYILHRFSKKLGINLRLPIVSRKVNDYMPLHVYNLIKNNTNVNDKKVLILGVSFNSNSGDMRYSPSIFLNNKLQEEGYSVYAYDPLVNETDFQVLKNVVRIKTEEELMKLLEKINILVVGAKHDVFQPLINKIMEKIRNKTIIDGRYLFDPEKVNKIDVKYIAVGVGKK